jgi:hypothetical protein
MGLNLHGIVRGAINSVNPDIAGVYLASTGSTTDASGKRVPTYADPVDVQLQVQALTWRDLQHRDMQNIQGVARAVYMFGNTQGVVRPDVKGGDLLQFPQVRGGANAEWLVVGVLETWTPDVAGWCKLGVVLQVGVTVPP